MGKETEYKLAVGDLQLLDCILCSRMVMEKLCAPYAYIRMRTTYYDTEDGFLAQRRWMLRLRTEDGRSVVTMKTPGEGHTRGEWEVESASTVMRTSRTACRYSLSPGCLRSSSAINLFTFILPEVLKVVSLLQI